MSNGYFLADTNSLVYTYRAGGPELLDQYVNIADGQKRSFAITRIVWNEIDDGPLKRELLEYIADRNITILPTPLTEQLVESGKISPTSAGEISMLEIASRESELGRATRIWADDKYFDSDQIMRKHPDAHRTMSAALLDEAYDQRFIDAADHQRFRAGYLAQPVFIDSERLRSFRYDFSSPEIEGPHGARTAPGMGRALGATAGGLGAAMTLADAAESGQRVASLYDMGNATGARSELIHFTARNVGAWGGAALGIGAGAAVSSPSGPGTIIGGLVGGAVGFVGGQTLADVLDYRTVYRQEDEQGKAWSFDPAAPARGWHREETVDTFAASGRPIEEQQRAVATGELASQLDRKATTASLELMLARPPVPREPYTLAAGPGDATSIPASAWHRDPGSGQWQRNVYEWQDDGTDLGRQILRETIVADPTRAAQLEAQSQAILRENVHLAPAAMAARYELAYHDNGWSRHGALPESAAHALRDDGRLIGSDGAEYRRQGDGHWQRSALFGFSSTDATPTMQHELDATRALLREGLVAHRELLAQRPLPEPPDFEANLASMAASVYASHGIGTSPEALQDMGRALAVDHRARGLEGPLMLQLQRDPATHAYSADSPMGVYTRSADGDMALRFTLTPDEARQLLSSPDPQHMPLDSPSPPRASSQDSPQTHDSPVATPTIHAPAAPRPYADPRDPGHPDHRLYTQIERGVAGIDADRGRTFDATSERLAMSAFHDVKVAGITSADHIAINRTGKPQPDGTQVPGGTLLFVVQGQDASDPAARRAVTDVAQAVERPVEQSLQRADALAQQQAQAVAQQRNQPTQDEANRAPRMM